MTQTKKQSLTEAIVNQIIAFTVSWLAMIYFVAPFWNLDTNQKDNFLITVFFAVLSIVRSYFVRRFYNWKHSENH